MSTLNHVWMNNQFSKMQEYSIKVTIACEKLLSPEAKNNSKPIPRQYSILLKQFKHFINLLFMNISF